MNALSLSNQQLGSRHDVARLPGEFARDSLLAGLLIHLIVAALLGGVFIIVTRQIWRLPSDFGVPAVSGLVFGLMVWLAVFLAVSSFLPQLAAIAAPAFIIEYIVYGTLTSLVFARLQPLPYSATSNHRE
jgi:hypothetical protein